MTIKQKISIKSKEEAGMLALFFSLPFELGLDIFDVCSNPEYKTWSLIKYQDWIRELENRYIEVDLFKIREFQTILLKRIVNIL